MNKSESITNIVAALAKAQAAFPTIPRDKTVTVTSQRTGKQYTFDYAPLETILKGIRPTLRDNGLAFMQSVSGEALTTVLMHTSGEWIESDPLPIKVSEQGAQALGSAITYARRYALTAALGIVAEDDDDGNAADGNAVEKKASGGASGHTVKKEAFEALPPDEQEFLRKIAADVSALISEDRAYDAYGFWINQKLDTEEMVAIQYLWDSKERSALTKAAEQWKARENAAAREKHQQSRAGIEKRAA